MKPPLLTGLFYVTLRSVNWKELKDRDDTDDKGSCKLNASGQGLRLKRVETGNRRKRGARF